VAHATGAGDELAAGCAAAADHCRNIRRAEHLADVRRLLLRGDNTDRREREGQPGTAFRILSVYRSSATGTEPRERGARSHTILSVEDRYQALREATAAALLGGAASTDPALRQAVAAGTPPDDLRTLVGKIRTRAYTVTDEDVSALRSRYSEDQLFEIVVSAAFGAARERLAAARRALEEA
jgi:hypothetical protein